MVPPRRTVLRRDVLRRHPGGRVRASVLTDRRNPTTQQYTEHPPERVPDDTLTSTWRHALALSPERLGSGGTTSRTIEYGAVEAPQEAGMQPRSGARWGRMPSPTSGSPSPNAAPGTTGVADGVRDRPEDNREPEEIASDVSKLTSRVLDDGRGIPPDRRGRLGRRGPPPGTTPRADAPGEPTITPAPETLVGDDTQPACLTALHPRVDRTSGNLA